MSEHKIREQAKVRTSFEVRPLLEKIAIKIGEVHGVVLKIQHTPTGLFFVNELGDVVQDGLIHCLCCTDEEVASGDFIMFFGPRCLRAALAQALAQDYVRRQLGGVN